MNILDSVNIEECTGCTACKTVCTKNAIVFNKDKQGFLYPDVDGTKCVHCGLCVSFCPTKTSIQKSNCHQGIYAVKHKDTEVLLQSSSGGLFTALSDIILEQGGVVYGAIHDEKLRTFHSRAESIEERNKQRGSKYVQSELRDIYRYIIKDLKEGKKVLFSGVPCQIDGLARIINSKPYRQNILLVDIICNGAPSPLIFEKYIDFCERKEGSKLIDHIHRPKDKGWGHIEKNIFNNGKIDNESDYSQAWKRIFYSGNVLRNCCYKCKYTSLERCSDITIGDYWGIQNTSIKINTTNGVSLLLANTEFGKSLLPLIETRMHIQTSSTEEAVAKQPRLRGICAIRDGRDLFWEEFEQKGADYVIMKYGNCTPFAVFKHKIKKCLIKVGLWKAL